MGNSCGEFKKEIETILERHGHLEAFRQQDDFHWWVKRDGLRPLLIERLENRLFVGHLGARNGRSEHAPLVEFTGEHGTWYPVVIRLATHASLHARDWVEGELVTNPLIERILADFTKEWARELRRQGY